MTFPESGIAGAPTRPDSVKLAIELWGVVVIAQLIGFIAQYPLMYERTQEIIDETVKQGGTAPASVTALAVSSMAIVIVILGGLAALAMWFTWGGRGWARQLLGVLSALIAVQLIFGVVLLLGGSDDTMNAGASAPAWAMIFQILGGVAAIGALVALMNKDTANFCRDTAAWRSANRANGRMR